MARPTLDTRTALYGEPRLSDAQVRMLRELEAGPAWVNANGTFYALKARHLLAGPWGGRRSWAALLERGRKTLAAIDAANAHPANKTEF